MMTIFLTICFCFLPVLIGLTVFGILNEWTFAFVVQILHETSLAIIRRVQVDRRILEDCRECHPPERGSDEHTTRGL